MTTVHVIVPEGIDDPARPSGGNVYDRRICRGLESLGWTVHESAVAGPWPSPDAGSCSALAHAMATVPDDGLVLIDGLVASAVPDALLAEAHRLRLVVLVHMPLGVVPGDDVDQVRDHERAALTAAVAIVTTSTWTKRWLEAEYALPVDLVHVAEPGVDAADVAVGSGSGGTLLCVAAVAPHKGHDILLAALAQLTELPWQCVCVGSLDRDPAFVERVRQQARDSGIADRVQFAGPRTGPDLASAYSACDVLVLASRGETYGMVVVEALAHGVPVITTDVGGIPDAVGRAGDGSRPGLLVPSDDPSALAAALRTWLVDDDVRRRLRRAAANRRMTLTDWSTPSQTIARVLTEAAA